MTTFRKITFVPLPHFEENSYILATIHILTSILYTHTYTRGCLENLKKNVGVSKILKKKDFISFMYLFE